MEDPSPNWDKWRNIPEAKLWQAVALSLNLDPDQVNDFDRAARFRDRLDVLRANLGRADLLRAKWLNMGDAADSGVVVADFAIWALSIGWAIPPELRELARVAKESKATPVADWTKWTVDHELWTLVEASYLLADIEPLDTDTISETQSVAGTIYRRLKDATLLAGKNSVGLPYFDSPTAKIGHRRVRPADCIAWARQKRIPIPEPLEVLSLEPACGTNEQSAARNDSNGLGGKERTTAFKLILGMAITGYRYDPNDRKSTVARRIVEDLQTIDIQITDDTVRAWLREAAEHVSSQTTKR